MKDLSVILLVGGKSTRLISLEEKNKKIPKALRKVNSKEIIYHVMMNYIKYDFKNFILPLGHFKDYFLTHFKNKKIICGKKCKIFFTYKDYLNAVIRNNSDINVLLVYTGLNTNKGSRILKILKKLKLQEFSIAYGDAIGNLNLKKLYDNHKKSKSIMTVAGTKLYSQYGHFIFTQNKKVIDFVQKPKLSSLVNIGYFFCKKETIKYFENYAYLDLEMGVMKKIAKKNKLSVYIHNGFWKSVDTLKDLKEINKLILK